MTKPATPPLRNHVVEIEAMDVAEWESGQRTPQAPDANLAELVRKTAAPPEPPTRVQTVARERAGTQLGAPVIPRPPSRARTEPPGPPPRPARARTSGGGPSAPSRGSSSPSGGPAAPSARATRVPDIPAAAAAEPRKSPAPMTSRGLDFSQPITATSATGARPAEPEPRRSLAQTPVGGVDFSLPVTATSPGMPAAPEPRRSLAQTPVGGVDFSLPATATGPGMPAAPEPRRSPAQTPVGGVDFSLLVTATTPAPPEPPAMRPLPTAASGTGFSMPAVERSARPPSEPRPRPPASSGTDGARIATATSDTGARPPDPESRPPTPAPPPLAWPPRVDPGAGASPFAERSQVGPGLNASPAGGAEPNTAWPPRLVPADQSLQRPPAAPDPAIQRSLLPDRDDGGPDRLKIAPSRRRLWWIGGGIASASLAAIIAAVVLPNPDAQPQASDPAGAPPAQATGSRRDPRPAQSVDRAAADLRERVRLARDAAAAGVPMTPPVDPPPMRHAPIDPLAWIRSGEPESAASHSGKKPARKLVVDYTARPDEPAPPSLVAQSEEDPAIGRARTAYTTGNQRLFVGDLAGAVRAYRESLEIYPGYVGGYRGLGLAYQQLGDKANALTALRAYVGAVPNARDAALIKKRIAHLQRR